MELLADSRRAAAGGRTLFVTEFAGKKPSLRYVGGGRAAGREGAAAVKSTPGDE